MKVSKDQKGKAVRLGVIVLVLSVFTSGCSFSARLVGVECRRFSVKPEEPASGGAPLCLLIRFSMERELYDLALYGGVQFRVSLDGDENAVVRNPDFRARVYFDHEGSPWCDELRGFGEGVNFSYVATIELQEKAETVLSSDYSHLTCQVWIAKKDLFGGHGSNRMILPREDVVRALAAAK